MDVNRTERDIMEHKGRIVKVRRLDDRPPNVAWYWLELGNCRTCKKWENPLDSEKPHCLDSRVTYETYHEYLDNDLCPYWEPGAWQGRDVPMLIDLLKAIGQLPGKPGQRLEVLQNVPWTQGNSVDAHVQQEQFMAMAEDADTGNESDDDWTDDLGPIKVSGGVESDNE